MISPSRLESQLSQSQSNDVAYNDIIPHLLFSGVRTWATFTASAKLSVAQLASHDTGQSAQRNVLDLLSGVLLGHSWFCFHNVSDTSNRFVTRCFSMRYLSPVVFTGGCSTRGKTSTAWWRHRRGQRLWLRALRSATMSVADLPKATLIFT